MKNTINGRKLVFGDPEQIAYLKKQRTIQNLIKSGKGNIDADLDTEIITINKLSANCPKCNTRIEIIEHSEKMLPSRDSCNCGRTYEADWENEQLILISVK